MMTTQGTLKLVGKKKSLKVQFTNQKGRSAELAVKEDELSPSLQKIKEESLESLDDLEVDLDLDQKSGQPIKVRPRGEPWETVSLKDFHNPYNFIPAIERRTQDPELGDCKKPVGHGIYHPDYWSGSIEINITTQTPLLIPDAAKVTENNGHKTFPVRVVNGRPYLAPTSVKGMLRSAYEAITNSRFSIFESHEDRLAYRMEARLGPGPIPARVEYHEGGLVLRLMKDSNIIGNAAKLPRYQENGRSPDKGEQQAALRYSGTNNLPQHKDHVWVNVDSSVVTEIIPWSQDRPRRGDWKEGWVCITGANIKSKQYERVFISGQSNELIPVTSEIKAMWRELILNYRKTHERDLEKRERGDIPPDRYTGSEPGKTAWSRHIYMPLEEKLEEGTLCYVDMNGDEVRVIQPVTISRRLYELSPAQLLPDSLKPAQTMEELSPADRVFGWVNQKGKGSYKGNLRIANVICTSTFSEAVLEFEGSGLPLAILGAPHPEQTRFYTAHDKLGTPLDGNQAKESGYHSNKRGLRGRKVYPHHASLPRNHWRDPTEDPTRNNNNGHYQEYHRPGDIRDDQNRSIRGWVKEGITFKAKLYVKNLSTVELGALLWLLDLPDDHFHRLGGGKPFGFGSVRVKQVYSCLSTGKELAKYYQSLSSVTEPSLDPHECVEQFKRALTSQYDNRFEEIPFIASFYRAAQGYADQLPIHYPRSTREPKVRGEAFQWFVANEKLKEEKWALPTLTEGGGLPILDKS